MNIKKQDLKMYYKMLDITKSYFDSRKLMITNDMYAIVNILGFDRKSFAVCIFENDKKSRFECFKNIEHFNDFVKYERWLND